MPLIDTLTRKTDLLDAGMSEPQATAVVKALANADAGQLATKADLADVRTEIEALRAISDQIALPIKLGYPCVIQAVPT